MIKLAKSLTEELREFELAAKTIAAKSPALGRQRFGTRVNGYQIICEQTRRNVRSHLVWATTWYIDYRRIGFNALIGKLEKE